MNILEIVFAVYGIARQHGGLSYRWYVGIASDPERRLFSDHNVSRAYDAWIYRAADSASTARFLENLLINKYDCDGGPGGGDERTHYVYAFKKTATTNPRYRLNRVRTLSDASDLERIIDSFRRPPKLPPPPQLSGNLRRLRSLRRV